MLICQHVRNTLIISVVSSLLSPIVSIASDVADIVKYHKEFVASCFYNSEGYLKSIALDAAIQFPARSLIPSVEAAIERPIGDPVLEVALTCVLRDGFTPNPVKMRELVASASRSLSGKMRDSVDHASVEVLACEALLRTNDKASQKFVIEHLANIIKDKHQGIRLCLTLDVIGRLRLTNLIDMVKEKCDKDDKDVLLCLARNNDKDAMSRIRSMIKDKQGLEFFVAQKDIVSLLSLTSDDLEKLVGVDDRMVMMWTAGHLAKSGKPQKLRDVMSETFRDPKNDEMIVLLQVLADYGDITMIEKIHDVFGKSPSVVDKLTASKAILSIAARSAGWHR